MPRILFRHIVADLLRIKVLTASVLVAVIAFGFSASGEAAKPAAPDAGGALGLAMVLVMIWRPQGLVSGREPSVRLHPEAR